MATAVSGGRTEELGPRAKSAIRGAFLGFFVDMFDVYLPAVLPAPTLVYFVSPSPTGSWRGE